MQCPVRVPPGLPPAPGLLGPALASAASAAAASSSSAAVVAQLA